MSDFELKDTLGPVEFASLLRQCADAVESGGSFELSLQEKTFNIQPHGKLKVEYEVDDEKHELEFEIKWREAA
ncbi:MAG TPA: amphi-Trp domain-containing protein [Armatimonadota bacterium]|jgi:amphi-Trp domain-containing protein